MTLLRFLPRFRRANREMETLRAREGWDRATIDSFQLDRLNALWGEAIAHVPYYRDLHRRACLPAGFASLAEFRSAVPLLPRATVKRRPAIFLSERAAKGRWRHTGGSTGKPMDVFWAHAAHLEMQRAKYCFFDTWGIDLFDRTVFLWGHGASFSPGLAGVAARIRQPVEDRLRQRLRLSAYRLGRSHLQRYLKRIAGFRPAAIYGYSNAVNLLAQEALAEGFRCDSLKSIILTSEPVTPKIVATVEKAFQVPAISEYGSLECGFMAGESNDRTLRVREDLVVIETAARVEGGYDIVVTVLANPSFPLIRYAIGDVTRKPLNAPSAGFALLEGIDGRNNDLLLSRNGQALHPMIVEDIFDHTPWVRRYRVAQKSDGSLAVMVEAKRGHPMDTARLAHQLSTLFGGCPVAVDAVAEIPALASGKHCWILSEQRGGGDPGRG